MDARLKSLRIFNGFQLSRSLPKCCCLWLSGLPLPWHKSVKSIEVLALALVLHMQAMSIFKISCNSERNKKTMNSVLQLQKLMPTASAGEISVLFISTYSNICPTTSLPGEAGKFEMQ